MSDATLHTIPRAPPRNRSHRWRATAGDFGALRHRRRAGHLRLCGRRLRCTQMQVSADGCRRMQAGPAGQLLRLSPLAAIVPRVPRLSPLMAIARWVPRLSPPVATVAHVLVPNPVLLRRLVEVPRRVTKPSAVDVARPGTPGDGDVPTRQKAERAPTAPRRAAGRIHGRQIRSEGLAKYSRQ